MKITRCHFGHTLEINYLWIQYLKLKFFEKCNVVKMLSSILNYLLVGRVSDWCFYGLYGCNSEVLQGARQILSKDCLLHRLCDLKLYFLLGFKLQRSCTGGSQWGLLYWKLTNGWKADCWSNYKLTIAKIINCLVTNGLICSYNWIAEHPIQTL